MSSMGEIIAHRLHDTVAKGEIGIDYTIDWRRDKNAALRRTYKVTDAIVKEILLEIHGSHYVKSEKSDSAEHPDDTVHVFAIRKELMPRFIEHANYVNVDIYIKVTWPDGEEPMFIISFHE